MKLLIAFVISFLSTWGFGVITNIPKRTLIPAGIAGAISWVVYVLVNNLTPNIILPNLFAAVTIGLIANFEAIIVRCTVNSLYIPSLVSLVPGALIYASMKDFTLGKNLSAERGLIRTLTISIAIAVGFVIAEAIFAKIRPSIQRWQHR